MIKALRTDILHNSGWRVWLADRLVAIARHFNPYEPWKRS